jgi:glycosyltransferase involved in cell wall biosynthesis
LIVVASVYLSTHPHAFYTPGGGEYQYQCYQKYLSFLGTGHSLTNESQPKPNDIIHFFGALAGAEHSLSFYKSSGIKIVISPNLFLSPHNSHNIPSVIKILPIADRIVVNSLAEVDNLSNYLELDSSSFSVVYNCFNQDIYNLKPSPLACNLSDVDYVLFVGNIEERKNIYHLAVACTQLRIPLVIVGGIRDMTIYSKIIKLSNPDITYIPSVCPDSLFLKSLYQTCGVFAMPSTLETPSIAALEAAACGARILITEIGSTREYFADLATYVDGSLPEAELIQQISESIIKSLQCDISPSSISNHIHQFSCSQALQKLPSTYLNL